MGEEGAGLWPPGVRSPDTYPCASRSSGSRPSGSLGQGLSASGPAGPGTPGRETSGSGAPEPAPAGPELPGFPPLGAELSYRDLGTAAARLFRALGDHPGDGFGPGAASAVAGTAPEETERLLMELAARHLLSASGPGRYRLHTVLRLYAQRQAGREDGPVRRREAARRMAEWYLRTAASAHDTVMPGRIRLGPAVEPPPALSRAGRPRPWSGARALPPPSPGQALAVLAAERSNLAAAVRAAEENGADARVWQLCEAQWALFSRYGHREDELPVHEAGIAAAGRCGDLRAAGRMHEQCGCALLSLGRLDEAEEHVFAAARAARTVRDPYGEAGAVGALGLLRMRQGRYEDALSLFSAAYETAARAGDPTALALQEHRAARALLRLGRYRPAEHRLTAALEAVRALPDRCEEAAVLTAFARLRFATGDPAAAAAFADEALELLRDGSGPLRLARTAGLRARCARELGDADEARHARTAAAYRRLTGQPVSVGPVQASGAPGAGRTGARHRYGGSPDPYGREAGPHGEVPDPYDEKADRYAGGADSYGEGAGPCDKDAGPCGARPPGADAGRYRGGAWQGWTGDGTGGGADADGGGDRTERGPVPG